MFYLKEFYSLAFSLGFACGYLLVPAIFVKKTIPYNFINQCHPIEFNINKSIIKKKRPFFSHVYTFCQKSICEKCKVYVWNLNSNPLIRISVLVLVPHCINYCSFEASFKIESVIFQLCSFSVLFWLFGAPCNSIYI